MEFRTVKCGCGQKDCKMTLDIIIDHDAEAVSLIMRSGIDTVGTIHFHTFASFEPVVGAILDASDVFAPVPVSTPIILPDDTCCMCGKTAAEAGKLFLSRDPYTEEIHPDAPNDETWWCDDCYHERLMDI